MSSEYHRLLLIFVDGVGLAPASSANPFSTEPSLGVRDLLGGPLTSEQCRQTDQLLLAPIDATLGVAGLPQSATGQAALFTGHNAAELMGRHVTGLPGPRVRRLVESSNLFQQAASLGRAVTFANAYTDLYLASLQQGRRRPSVTTCAVASADLSFRRLAELEEGLAVSWDIRRDRFAEHVGRPLRTVTPYEAGYHLATLGSTHQLTVFETFITDMAGHGRLGFSVEEAIARVDGFIAGVCASRDSGLTILLSSDHGNLEDTGDRRHTRNPVPLLVVGPLAPRFAGIESIVEVTPRIVELLGEGR